MLTHDFEDVVLCRYVYSRLRNRPPPREASFDAFLRPGAKAAKVQRKCFPPKGLSSMLWLHVTLTSFTFQPLFFSVLRNAIDFLDCKNASQIPCARGTDVACPAHMPGEDKPRPAANFSAFLKRPEQAQKPVRQAASFSSFLRKQPGQAEPAAAAATESPTDAESVIEAGPGPEQKPVTVLYGTEYGFSKEIAEKLLGKLKESGALWYAPSPCLTLKLIEVFSLVGPRCSCAQSRQLHGSAD